MPNVEMTICPCAASEFASDFSPKEQRPLSRLLAVAAIMALSISTTHGAASDAHDMTVPPCCRGPTKDVTAALRRKQTRPKQLQALQPIEA